MEVDDEDYITISDDDDDVCVLKHVINLEPICIDISDGNSPEASSNSDESPEEARDQEQSQNNQHNFTSQNRPNDSRHHRPEQQHPDSTTQQPSQYQYRFPHQKYQSNSWFSSQPRPQRPVFDQHHRFSQPPTWFWSQPQPNGTDHRQQHYHHHHHHQKQQQQQHQQHQSQTPTPPPTPGPIPNQEPAQPSPPPPAANIPTRSQDKPQSQIQTENNDRPEQNRPLQSETLQEQQPPQPPNDSSNQQDNLTQPPPTDSELLIAKKNLGNEKYKKNLFNEAIRIYKEASQLAKKLGDKDMSATIHFNLAMTYDKLGSFNQAADECALAVRLKDDYMKPHLKRAEIYERLRKFDEAVICWEHICELDSNNREYAIRLSRVRDAAKRLRKGCYYQLLGLNPSNFTKEDLKKAYKRKALSHHPDRHPDADIVTRRIQEKLFKDASEAHSSLQLRFGYNR